MPKPLFPGRRWPVALLLMVVAALALFWATALAGRVSMPVPPQN